MIWLTNEINPEGNPTSYIKRWTEEEILRDYFPYWCGEMIKKYGKECVLVPQDCLDDWVIVNWAWEAKE